jgi:hypothetical protein
LSLRPVPGLYLKKTKHDRTKKQTKKKTGGHGLVVEYLPIKYKVPSSIPSTEKKKENLKKETNFPLIFLSLNI